MSGSERGCDVQVFRGYHRGVAFAIPATQAVRVEEQPNDAQRMQLWLGCPTHVEDPKETRWLGIRVHGTTRWLGCTSPTLVDFDARTAMVLSPVIKNAVGLPHVVGWTNIAGELVWLLDLTRLPVAT